MSMVFSEKLISVLERADWVVAFTGAGVSAESGVPTFRGNDGMWAKFKPEELASMNAFIRNPDLVWEWYAQRKQIMASITPNPGHLALAEMEKVFSKVTVVTQNIDNLHRRAGSSRVLELHGNIERNYCIQCGRPYSNEAVLSSQKAPNCGTCGGLVRPDVVWFGEMLPEEEWDAALRAMESADLVLSIGTSGVVYPAASLPMAAKHAGAFLVEVNPEATPLTPHVDEFLKGLSGAMLPVLCETACRVRTQHTLKS
jgi:NAD-dependent deacetylase